MMSNRILRWGLVGTGSLEFAVSHPRVREVNKLHSLPCFCEIRCIEEVRVTGQVTSDLSAPTMTCLMWQRRVTPVIVS